MFSLINIIKFVCLATKKLPIGETSILTLVERQTRYAVTKKLNQNLLEDYTKAINERPRRIHGYQSAKKLFELTQTA